MLKGFNWEFHAISLETARAIYPEYVSKINGIKELIKKLP